MDSDGGAGGGPGGGAEEAQAEAEAEAGDVEDEGETAPIGQPGARPFVPPPRSDHPPLPFYMVSHEHRNVRPGMKVAPPHYRHRPAPGSAPLTELEELIESGEFDEALEFIRTRPGEILPEGTRFHGEPAKDGEDEDAVVIGRMTALHVAIENSETPPSVVCALLVAVPSVVRAVDEDGALPLHYACAGRHAYGEDGAALVRLLLAMYPQAAAVVELAENATPLHFLMQMGGNVKPEVVRMLLDAAYGRGDYANANANAPLEAPEVAAGSATEGERGGGDRKPAAKGGGDNEKPETSSADALCHSSTVARSTVAGKSSETPIATTPGAPGKLIPAAYSSSRAIAVATAPGMSAPLTAAGAAADGDTGSALLAAKACDARSREGRVGGEEKRGATSSPSFSFVVSAVDAGALEDKAKRGAATDATSAAATTLSSMLSRIAGIEGILTATQPSWPREEAREQKVPAAAAVDGPRGTGIFGPAAAGKAQAVFCSLACASFSAALHGAATKAARTGGNSEDEKNGGAAAAASAAPGGRVSGGRSPPPVGPSMDEVQAREGARYGRLAVEAGSVSEGERGGGDGKPAAKGSSPENPANMDVVHPVFDPRMLAPIDPARDTAAAPVLAPPTAGERDAWSEEGRGGDEEKPSTSSSSSLSSSVVSTVDATLKGEAKCGAAANVTGAGAKAAARALPPTSSSSGTIAVEGALIAAQQDGALEADKERKTPTAAAVGAPREIDVPSPSSASADGNVEDKKNGGATSAASTVPGGGASDGGSPPLVGLSLDETQAREGATCERPVVSLCPVLPSQQHPVISQGQAVAVPPVASALADAMKGEEQEGRPGQALTLATAVPSAQDQAPTAPVGNEQTCHPLLQRLLSMLPPAQSDGGAVVPGLQWDERLAVSLRPVPPSQQHPVIPQGQAVTAPPVASALAGAAEGEEQEGRSGQAPTLAAAMPSAQDQAPTFAAAVPSAHDQALNVPVGDEQTCQLLLQCLLSMLPPAQSDGGAVASRLQCAGAVPQAGVVSPEASQAATNAFTTMTFVPTTGLMDTRGEALKALWQYLHLLAGGYEGLHRYFSTMLPSSAPPDLIPAATAASVVGSQAHGAPQLVEGEQRCVGKLRAAGVACFSKPPPPKSQLAAKASGGILRIPDLFEMTPLHRACCRPYTGGDESLFVNFMEIIQVLLNDSSYPGAASVASVPDGKGRLPLHHILDLTVSRGGNGRRTMPHLAAITAVLEAFPGAASVPDGITGLSPVHLVYLSARPAHRRLRIDAVHHVMGIDMEAYRAKQLWETIKALLLAVDEAGADSGSGGNGREGYRSGGGNARVAGRKGSKAQRRRSLVLHAAARFPCPPSVFRVAILLHGGQARLRDGNGDLPLHAAARRREGVPSAGGAAGDRHPWLPAEFVRPPDGGVRRGSSNDVTYARFVAEEEEEELAEANAEEVDAEAVKEVHAHVDELMLLANKFGPGSSYLDREGRLPLNLAIESGRSWASGGIPAIANAAPLALVTRDIKTRLRPFMLAAVGANSDLDTIFELLELAPSALSGIFAASYGVTKGGQKRNQSIGGGAGVDSVSVKKQRSA